MPFFRCLTLALLLLTLGAVIGCADETLRPDWDYSGDGGPTNWAALSDDYAQCGEGLQQSPVNLIDYTRKNGPNLSLNTTAVLFPPSTPAGRSHSCLMTITSCRSGKCRIT